MGNKIKKVRPDERGRITLGEISKSVSSYDVEVMEDGKILLIPYIEIPKNQIINLKNYNKTISVHAEDEPLDYESYNHSTNWKEIEYVNFPETEEVGLILTVDEEIDDDLSSWS